MHQNRPIFRKLYKMFNDDLGQDISPSPAKYTPKLQKTSQNYIFPHSPQRQNIKYQATSPQRKHTVFTQSKPSLYQTNKSIPTKSITPGATYQQTKKQVQRKIYASDRFPVKYEYAFTPGPGDYQVTRPWIASGQAFSGDRDKINIDWLKYNPTFDL
ncbi:hypothetical protein SS50377_20188 [Spironucleus salmonicida]|uniref:Uncharacterized protein n=1 Tax=Spironucleus salmonicida TaxID=348837 RepID=V6LLZ9_9EUKA|nr:hypothetical protein SS50377_20188 [Spironucleus salmonicida]|eukprot:EST45243.1 Hypothetical protein SS50377_14819 [Spironucleus salmonicida]